ncbi:MAG: hypothetical protein KAH03_06235 [Cocleimonas sp.]|nr:hypothetical protein [Cocleimonas sp.]
MDVKRINITISEDAARSCSATIAAPATIDLDSYLGQSFAYSYSAGTADNTSGALLFKGKILSANYNPSADEITLQCSDLRKVKLNGMSDQAVDDLVPGPDLPEDSILTGEARINDRLKRAAGHVELTANGTPRYTAYDSPAGSISVTSNDDLCVTTPSGGNSSAGGSPINTIGLEVEYSYNVNRSRICNFNWNDQGRAIPYITGEERLPAWDALTTVLDNIDASVLSVGAKFLPSPAWIPQGSGAPFLWPGDAYNKIITGAAGVLQDKWNQKVTEKFTVTLSAGSTGSLGEARQSIFVKYTTVSDPTDWEESKVACKYNEFGPQAGIHTNPDIVQTFINGKHENHFGHYATALNGFELGEKYHVFRDYLALDEEIKRAMLEAQVTIKRSHRIGRLSTTTIIDPSADVTQNISIVSGKVSASGKAGNIAMNINTETGQATMTTTLYIPILAGGTDGALVPTDEMPIETLPIDNSVNYEIPADTYTFIGPNGQQGKTGLCFEGASKSATTIIVDPSASEAFIKSKLASSMQFVVSLPDINDEMMDTFDVDRPEANQTITVKV